MRLPVAILSIIPLGTHRAEPVGPLGQAIIVLLCLGLGGLMTVVGVGYLQTYNRVRKSDPVPVRQLTDTGIEVELAGRARTHEATRRSPFTDTECLVLDWKAERYRSGSEGSAWSTLDSGEARHPFRLDDGTGTALVGPRGATLELTNKETIEVGPDESPPSLISAYLDETDRVDRDHDHKRRYIEQRLEPGDDVHVFGPVQRIGHAVDMPGGTDAMIGVNDPDRGLTVGEDDLSELVDRIKADTLRFVITTGTKREAEQHLLKKGLVIAGFGVVFGLIPLVFVLVF
jgi:hypothetical protein